MPLKNGVDVKDVATMVGNSPEIIYRPECGAESGAFFTGVLRGWGERKSVGVRVRYSVEWLRDRTNLLRERKHSAAGGIAFNRDFGMLNFSTIYCICEEELELL